MILAETRRKKAQFGQKRSLTEPRHNANDRSRIRLQILPSRARVALVSLISYQRFLTLETGEEEGDGGKVGRGFLGTTYCGVNVTMASGRR